ncbi:hypothetical protein ZIOFF_072717 [Zingiber officinale]|uniref:CST complex subunit STN1 n=1 Tax=Zingiber officinale TaxID=94328 RepID=A0A8J5ELZ3_ZINOF|nr:hypothetical protein ZIOFF_072717 [Zingiber officinale]
MEAVAVELEKLVRLRGMITLYRGSIQLKVENDPNMETLHSLDCIRLGASDFLSLSIHTHPNSSSSFTLKGRPVARVETVGVVVSVTHTHKTLTILVYDGSGRIPCTLFLLPQPEQGGDRDRSRAGRIS